MALSIQLGYPDVPKSITNPNVKEQYALDREDPMSFLTFIKTIAVSFEPDSLQLYYNFYLKEWNLLKNNQGSNNQSIIVERYRDFIKDISLNYTTLEERSFLSKIDFNDPFDLDIAIGFYSKKLKEIAQYYNSKREDVKFEMTKKKILGTNQGLQQTILDFSLNYLENIEDGPILYDINSIKRNLDIELEEIFDYYPYYFNQIPNESIYDKKDLDYGEDIFLKSNTELISEIFSGMSDQMKSLKEVDDLFDTKRKLSQNSVSTDFYYISTGNTVTDFLTGKLFEATNPAGNLMNRSYPTTASTEQTTSLRTPRQQGFFIPAKNGMLFLDGKVSRYEINFANLQPNTIYYYADPSITGVNGDVLIFYADDTFLKHNFSSGKANNQPIQTDDGGSYYGYVSKLSPKEAEYYNSIFNQGYISDSKKDIYNNIFALYKNDSTFNQVIENVSTNIVKSLVINGHQFFDTLYFEGYQFNYGIYDDTTYQETIRSSLTSFTPTFSSTTPVDYNLFFRYFKPYDELIAPQTEDLTVRYVIKDGAFFRKNNGQAYDDPISSDLNAFPGSGVYYFSTLLEAGVNDSDPVVRALLDPSFPSITAVFSENARPTGNNNVSMIDGGNFTDNFNFDYSLDSPAYAYDSTLLSSTKYSLPSAGNTTYMDRLELNGRMFIQNSQTKQVLPLHRALPYISSRHNTSVFNQLTGSITKFELAYDTLFIQTSSYIVIEKIVYDETDFEDPKTISYSLSHDTGEFDKISNRFKVDNFVYYAILRTSSDFLSSNNFNVYPEIYKFDLVNYRNNKIFPLNSSDITNFFSISGENVKYIKAEQPTLTYSSRNEIFTISFLLKDQNNLFSLHEYDFEENPNVEFLTHNSYKTTDDQISNIFNANYQSTLNFYLSSSLTTLTLSSQELTL